MWERHGRPDMTNRQLETENTEARSSISQKEEIVQNQRMKMENTEVIAVVEQNR
jgi:hypothetical protein